MGVGVGEVKAGCEERTRAGTRPAPTGGFRGEGEGGVKGGRAGTRPAPTGG